MKKSIRTLNSGFTLIELLVVIAILTVLVALLVPAVQKVRESGNRIECANHLRQIGLAFWHHHHQQKVFPDGGRNYWTARSTSVDGTPLSAPQQTWGWAYQILPYLEQDSAWKQADANAAELVLSLYYCPSRRRPAALWSTQNGLAPGMRGHIDYAGNGGIGQNILPGATPSLATVFPNGYSAALRTWSNESGTVVPPVPYPINTKELKDGASTTILVGERQYNRARLNQTVGLADENSGFTCGYDWDVIRWAYNLNTGKDGVPAPDRHNLNPADYWDRRFGSSHPGGCQFVFADGAVKSISWSISVLTFQRLCHRSDGQAISASDY